MRGALAMSLRRWLSIDNNRAAMVWALALTPVLIAPPLISLLVVFAPRSNEKPRGDANILATVAIVNVILSVLFWRSLAGTALGFDTWLWEILRGLGIGEILPTKALPV